MMRGSSPRMTTRGGCRPADDDKGPLRYSPSLKPSWPGLTRPSMWGEAPSYDARVKPAHDDKRRCRAADDDKGASALQPLPQAVLAGLDPAIHVWGRRRLMMRGSSPRMTTRGRYRSADDDKRASAPQSLP